MTKTSIGKFQIVGQLGRGGMAELYVCRLQGIGGFAKDVVIKRIMPERAGDPYFVKMFLDEARVAANLTHPNIVQVFEVGVEDGVPYLAMEYIKGVTLGMVIREAHRQNKIHFGHAAKIICGICEALDYAHNALNADGEPLELVHRDVTPGNIVISREGIPKLLDFGVAKAKGRMAQTEAGTLKGKIRYMAPEQVSQGPLDARADVFSLGVCLFELTTGQNPFGPRGGNDVAILKNVINGVFTRPSELVPGFSPALEQIILSAIHQDVHQRCASPRELRDQLEAFVATDPRYASTPRELAAWVRDIIPGYEQVTHDNRVHPARATPSGVSFTAAPGAMPLLSIPWRDREDYDSGAYGALASTAATIPGKQGAAPVADSNEAAAGSARAKARMRALKWGLPALVVIAAAGGVWRATTRTQPRPPSVTAPPPERPAPRDDDDARAYLAAAERLIADKRLEPARDMVGKARELKIRDPALNIRLAQLSDTLATDALLRTASAHLKQRDWRAAVEAAKQALERSPGNTEALAIIGSARAASPQSREEPASGKSKGPALGAVALRRERQRQRDGVPGGRAAGRSSADDTADNPPAIPTLAARTAPVPAADVPSEAPVRGVPDSSVPAAGTPRSATPLSGAAPAAGKAIASSPQVTPPRLTPAATVGGSGPPAAAARKSIPKPTLPRVYQADDVQQVARACAAVETSAISAAGLDAAYVRGITGPLRRLMGTSAEVYPVAMYYFIVREAALNHDKAAAAANLAAAYSSGVLLKFKDLPAIEHDL